MKKALLIFALIILLALGGLGYYLFGNYSDGYRAGTMIKFSKRGVILKTYEGQLNLGMVLNDNSPGTHTSVNNIWEFSVSGGNDEVVKKLEEALLSGKRVKVHYNEKFVRLFWRGDNKYFVDEVQILN